MLWDGSINRNSRNLLKIETTTHTWYHNKHKVYFSNYNQYTTNRSQYTYNFRNAQLTKQNKYSIVTYCQNLQANWIHKYKPSISCNLYVWFKITRSMCFKLNVIHKLIQIKIIKMEIIIIMRLLYFLKIRKVFH